MSEYPEYANPNALVSTEWVSQRLADSSVKLVEVDVDTNAYYERATSPAPSAGTGPRSSRTRCGATSSPGEIEELLRRVRHQQRRHHRPLRRQQQLVRRLRLLAAQDVRPQERQADGRRPQEVDGREPPLTTRMPQPEPSTTRCRRAQPRAARQARPVLRAWRRAGKRPWSTSARPPSTAARSWRRPGCRRPPSAAATSPAPPTCRGRRPSTKTAPSSPPDELARAVRRQGRRRPTRTSSPTAASASAPPTPGSCSSTCSGYPNVRNYDGSWTEWGSMVGVPIENPAAS